MRITKPCAGDDPFRIEGGTATINGKAVKYEALEQHELLLSDMSLAPPDKNGKCRRLFDRLGVHADNLFGCGSSAVSSSSPAARAAVSEHQRSTK